MKKAIRQAVDQAGGYQPLADQLSCTKQFVHASEQRGWLPLEKAKIVSGLYGIALVDLVRSDIADAMRLASQS
jgi:hypothetical protein